MKEVMAKSKLYKYERQKAKEDDDELREELDKDLPNILCSTWFNKAKATSTPGHCQQSP